TFDVADSTVILSPHFKVARDQLLTGELTFTDEGWLKGDQATNDSAVSSYDVVDQWVRILGNRKQFPNLKRIVITGHSAGGQFTQRYALGNQMEAALPKIHFQYFVVNPGTYVYLTGARVTNDGKLATPDLPGCAYDDYKYGLRKLNAYQRRVSVS